MELNFTKMQGLGNDFVVLDGRAREIQPGPDQIRALADRRFGIGCDQVLLIQPPDVPGADIRFRIFNQDGGEVEQCGNGARCIGAYLDDRDAFPGDVLTAATPAGNITIHRAGGDRYRVNMGVPDFTPEAVPILAPEQRTEYVLDTSRGPVSLMAVSMGNPHAVLVVASVDQADLEGQGREIQAHPWFPRGVNVGFMEIVDAAHVRLRVLERGVGETLACGSGACAAMVTGRAAGRLETPVDIGLKGGHMTVAWAGAGEPVWMTGPATTVYTGQISL